MADALIKAYKRRLERPKLFRHLVKGSIELFRMRYGRIPRKSGWEREDQYSAIRSLAFLLFPELKDSPYGSGLNSLTNNELGTLIKAVTSRTEDLRKKNTLPI